MLSRWTIRKKLQIAMVVLGLVIAALGYSSFRGVYAYKELVATLSSRASEIPLTAELTRAIDDLRLDQEPTQTREILSFSMQETDPPSNFMRPAFSDRLQNAREILARYKSRLESSHSDALFLADRSEELQTAEKIGELINEIAWRNGRKDLVTNRVARMQQDQDLDQLGDLAHQLPNLLTRRMVSFRDEVRTRYRTWIVMTWSSAILAAGMLIGLFVYARSAVVRPFKNLLFGARRVAQCDFAYRIHTSSSDEIAELAHAINLGAQSFLAIQKDLKEQVRQRSEEVIRNEQLASVGFLAAGVAHEINNPLAAIAWSAEALEARLHRILHPVAQSTDDASTLAGTDIETLRTYLRRIQDEAFRCKGITERLLDFSRLGTVQRKQLTDMNGVVEDVVEMVRHLGPYRSQRVECELSDQPANAWACPQEMKQVVLNLVTNALESLEPDSKTGLVRVRVQNRPELDQVHLVIEDNGCGMDQEVLKHLFEPFFTRRRDGRGTGLGLPITNRIITDHGGRITPRSDGPGMGSRFEIVLPSKLTNDSLYDNQHELAIA
ncbi:MAG: sensor histidine kinase [Planctomycetota bacterium]|jgi:two-component system NtrC family sensor kinase|nr:ATP-binding protein [Planctomycetaceae bacterium]MCE2813804.1 ATP-binding protein [Planctomycetaceae bacterium]